MSHSLRCECGCKIFSVSAVQGGDGLLLQNTMAYDCADCSRRYICAFVEVWEPTGPGHLQGRWVSSRKLLARGSQEAADWISAV